MRFEFTQFHINFAYAASAYINALRLMGDGNVFGGAVISIGRLLRALLSLPESQIIL